VSMAGIELSTTALLSTQLRASGRVPGGQHLRCLHTSGTSLQSENRRFNQVCRRMAEDKDGWLGANRVYQNVRSTLTYTEVWGRQDHGSYISPLRNNARPHTTPALLSHTPTAAQS